MNTHFKQYLKQITNASDCKEIEIIQSLWSGYGQIARIELVGAAVKTVVVKHINLTKGNEHPRGWNTNLSHQRKVKSYEVETNWYKHWIQDCTHNCKWPNFIGTYEERNEQWIILEDLNVEFPLRKHKVSIAEVKVCLHWLAHFHATFMQQEPTDLWAVGTYWHLETRTDEWEKMEHEALKAKAHLIDTLLNKCQYKTIVHGDAKLANFCFSKSGREVAAVDFQYVGGGCGMKDVAYFLGSCLSSEELVFQEKDLLEYYFEALVLAIKNSNSTIDCNKLLSEWRTMYPIACVDFTRFLLGWMPEHQKINPYQSGLIQSVLASLS